MQYKHFDAYKYTYTNIFTSFNLNLRRKPKNTDNLLKNNEKKLILVHD